MKKFGMLVIGIVIGATLTLSPQIYGAGAKLLGSKVDNTLDIKLNGSSIGQGAVINGTSYLPVRSAANALGLEVSVDSAQVNLSVNSSEENSKAAIDQQKAEDALTAKKNDLITKINDLNKNISKSNIIISSTPKTIEDWTKRKDAYEPRLKLAIENQDQIAINDFTNMVKLCEDNINKANSDLENAKSNIITWKNQLADLKSQLDEINQK